MTTQALPIAQHRPEDLIFVSQTDELLTNSLLVAKHFNKPHKDVIRRIETLHFSDQFMSAHFCAHVENQQVGIAKRDIKSYQMNFSGFMAAVMSFNGKKAAIVKEAFINAFNLMAEKLAKQTHQEPLPFMLPTKAELMDDFKDGLDTRILLDIENGQIVRSMVVPQDAFVCNKEKFISFMGNNRLFTNQEIIAINTIAAKRLSRM
ncbi:Rha family transcriptional regulator [Vibrio sp. ER1A]|uniref:Rha family transcriptional regulator n=1 Tax=Vibrio sp. ER1A TaxID=1517681 RepID=UPI00068E1C39|nr:Rha family transcriptional regulator [Vibrio sp. ER1A]